jgi:hypothetical protein
MTRPHAATIVGWALCAAAIGIGFALMTERGALILHAIVAPIAFAGLTWVYSTRFGNARPLTTALLFVSIVVSLDVFVVAILIQRSFAMFASPAWDMGSPVPNFHVDLGDRHPRPPHKANASSVRTAAQRKLDHDESRRTIGEIYHPIYRFCCRVSTRSL